MILVDGHQHKPESAEKAKPNRIEAGAAKAEPENHREANATAPVLDSTPV